MLKNLMFLKSQIQLYYPIAEFIFLFLILLLILYYINKLARLPLFIILFITLDLFLIFPSFTNAALKFLLKYFFLAVWLIIRLSIKLFEFSRIELVIVINVILLGLLLFQYWKKKRTGKKPGNDQVK